MKSTFLMAGGGTGGHIVPAIAVAQELRRRGHKVIFSGTKKGLESRLVPAAGFSIEWIEIGGLKGLGLGALPRLAVNLPRAVLISLRVLRREKVAAVFSMGGFVAGPVVLAAAAIGVPLVVMEPNAMPGLTNRRMAKLAYRALLMFEEAGQFFKPGRWEVSGLPVREAFLRIKSRRPGKPLTVLVTGGSRGSRTLNNAAKECWKLAREAGMRVRWIHQSGVDTFKEMSEAFAAEKADGCLEAFFDDMVKVFDEADLIICRSGASTVSELAAAGKASILVPYPFAADNHQLKNAEAMVRQGAAVLVLDKEMTGARMLQEIRALSADSRVIEAMAAAARKMAKPEALTKAVTVLEQAAKATG